MSHIKDNIWREQNCTVLYFPWLVYQGLISSLMCICQWTVQHVAVVGGLVKFEDEPQ
ncbi:hypothetical protein BDR05DRAFT_552046 [Suillus weaverae]|nr:hypothetical protein BDR05DRAFT_552046 [Suillus weaverae]